MRRKVKLNLHQLALPFGERRTRVISYEDRARFFWLLALASLCSLALYFYAINATARNIALRANLEGKLVETQTALSSLEFSYIEQKSKVDIETAYQYGFTEVKDPLYVSRTHESTLTLNTVKR